MGCVSQSDNGHSQNARPESTPNGKRLEFSPKIRLKKKNVHFYHLYLFNILLGFQSKAFGKKKKQKASR